MAAAGWRSSSLLPDPYDADNGPETFTQLRCRDVARIAARRFTADMPAWIKNPKIVLPGLLGLAGVLWLAFGFFGVHLLLTEDRVDEAPPVFEAAAAAVDPAATVDTMVDTTVDTSSDDLAGAGTEPMADAATEPMPATTGPDPATATTPTTEFSGTFVSREHPTTGRAIVLGNGTGQRFLRFESFETDNGPDLNVYLVNSSAGGVDDVIDLGDLKGNVGDQNYEIPAGVDLAVHDTVLLWCVRFSSPFGEASLAPA